MSSDALSRYVYEEKEETYERMDPDDRIIPIQREVVDDAREMLRDIAGVQDQDMAIQTLNQQDSLPANYKVENNIIYKLIR